MWNLIKFEFSRKTKLLLILLVGAVALNTFGIIKGGSLGSVTFIALVPLVISIVFLSEVIKTYSDDVNKKSGYMLFMTPNSGYKIIGAKIITVILEGLILVLAFGILAAINGIYMLYDANGSFDFLSEGFSQLVNGINMFIAVIFGINLGHILVIVLLIFICIVSFITTVYAAITIRKSIFSEAKFGGFLSFVIFIILNILTSKISDAIMNLFANSNFELHIQNIDHFITATQMFIGLLPAMLTTIALSTAFIVGSGYLLEKRINL